MRLRFFWAAITFIFASVVAAHAEASCGDYLHVGGAGLASELSNSFSQDQNTSPGTVPIPQPLNPRPCHGPNCGRGVPLPSPPAPAPTSSGPKNLEVWINFFQADASVLIQVLEQRDESPSAGYPFGVKRPPRA